MKNKIFVSTIFLFLLNAVVSAQGVWTQKASFPDTAKIDAMAFGIGTRGYVTQGGEINWSRLSSSWEYDAPSNSWTQKQNFSGTARWQGISFTIGSKGYIGTGQSIYYNNDLWEYDPGTDTWTQKASMPTFGHNFSVGFSIGNKAYVGLGLGNSGYLNDFWEYDAVLNTWTQKADFPPPNGRLGAVGLSIGTKGYVGTGLDQFGTLYDDFWEYDPSDDTWTQKTSFPGGVRDEMDGAHFTIGNYGYVGMGTSLVNYFWVYYNDFWRYDPSNDTWTEMPALPASGRIGAIGFTTGNTAYVGFGYNGTTSALSDLWSFTPHLTGVNDFTLENSIEIFPNPFSYETKLTTTGNFKNATLTLYSAFGKKVKTIKNISGRTIKLYKDNLPGGIYFIRLRQDDKTILTDKLIITE